MSQKLATETFRNAFKVIDKEALHWFPGHMGKGLKQMQQKLRQVDCIIEIHDARIPFSGRNNDFKYTISGIKPHITVFNKIDLIDNCFIKRVENKLQDEHTIFTNCKDQRCKGVKKLLPLVQNLIANSNRFNRATEENYCIMIIGVPNVGKSSLINALRARYLGKGKASLVGPVPGVTRSVLHKIKMCENPLIYVLDTPGILTPNIENTEVGLKLALCATIKDHLVGETTIADYLLFWLNKHNYFKYVDYFQMEKATDNILEILTHISVKNNKMLRIRNTSNEYIMRPNFDYAAQIMLKAFREGSLGKICLDEDFL